MGRDIICDLAIVGGGLAGGIIAHAFALRRPNVSIRLIEPGEMLGSNHIWSFFSNDVAATDRWMIEPFVSMCWNGHDVRFPAHSRSLGVQYNAIRSEDFDARLRRILPPGTIVQSRAAVVRPTSVGLPGGGRVRAKGVIDARGPAALNLLDVGWQKFLGQEVRLGRPHGLDRPIVMDATVEQIDGYRFVYCLPFGPDRMFIEDTYYSDTPVIARDTLAQRIADYAAAQGWDIAEIIREEQGALPVTLGGDFRSYWQSGGIGVAKAGTRAALFHPTTGYSLPDAVRTARILLDQSDLSGAALHDRMHEHAAKHWEDGGFYRMLNKMLFRAARNDQRYRVLERFYRLRPGVIARFYAGNSTALDKLRIVAGRPPVPLLRGVAVATGLSR